MNLAVISGRTTRTDFIPITVFGKQADFCSQYVAKGDLVEVKGHIVTGSYKKNDGTTVYTTDVNVDDIKKLQGKPKAEHSEPIPTMPEIKFEEINEQIPF